jgi:predicted dehydrogenase
VKHINRRSFIRSSATTGAGLVVSAKLGWAQQSPNERIAFACVGIGGKGESDSNHCAMHGDVVAICDIDDQRLEKKANQKLKIKGENQEAEEKQPFLKAKRYNDYRKMLDEMGKSIDAVTTSTSDHMHAPPTIMAMRMGKHAFVQKPATHSLQEARLIGQIARERKLATMMGNQGTSHEGLRRAAEIVQAGALGIVKEVHVWTNRPIWPQGVPRPKGEDPVPEHLKWDLWLGCAPVRPYKKDAYAHFAWRGWWDFGTGALGDMACHTLNMPFLALDLRNPISVEAVNSPNNKDSYPSWSVIRYEFAATSKRPAVTLFWADGGDRLPEEKRVTADMLHGKKRSNSGALIVGEKGSLYSPDDYGAQYFLLPEGSFKDYKGPDKTLPRAPAEGDEGHFREWVRAIKGGAPAFSNFPDYAGPLTETVLLGNLAVWAGEKVEWDAQNQKATNCPDVEPLIRKTYRQGFGI